MKRSITIIIPALIVSAMIVVGWLLVRQAQFDVFEPAGWVALQQKNLLIFAAILCLIIVVPVFTMLLVFAWRYREGNNKAKYSPEWSKSNKLEMLWWGIPILIIIILGVVTWQTTHQLDPYKRIVSKNRTIDVQVVALQWKWLFIYPQYGVASVNELAMPVDYPVSFRLTADAPMSAFWVPRLGSQIYSMNSMASQLNLVANQAGVFDGYNTNINGEGYADMKFQVNALSKNDFDRWIKTSQRSTNMLTPESYEALVKPSKNIPTKRYMLMKNDLFDTIVMKYMHGKVSEKSGTKMNHSQMNMRDKGQ